MRISDWSSDVCSSDLRPRQAVLLQVPDGRDHRPQETDAAVEHILPGGPLVVDELPHHAIPLRGISRQTPLQSASRRHRLPFPSRVGCSCEGPSASRKGQVGCIGSTPRSFAAASWEGQSSGSYPKPYPPRTCIRISSFIG